MEVGEGLAIAVAKEAAVSLEASLAYASEVVDLERDAVDALKVVEVDALEVELILGSKSYERLYYIFL